MHNVDIDIVEMAMDVMKFAINRITDADPILGFPKKEAELRELIGETITPDGIGGEKAFQLFRDVLLKSSVSIDHRRHLAFVPASPTRAGIVTLLVFLISGPVRSHVLGCFHQRLGHGTFEKEARCSHSPNVSARSSTI